MDGVGHKSPLMVACASGCFEMIKFLIRTGAKLSHSGEDGVSRNVFDLLSCRPELER
jgi:hypothetical protein